MWQETEIDQTTVTISPAAPTTDLQDEHPGAMSQQVPQVSGVNLTFNNLSFAVENSGVSATLKGLPVGKTQILDGVTGYVRPGEVCALIGPSGAGKSTLLDLLSLRLAHDSGSICVNGETLTSEFFRHHAAYVPQEDQLWGSLTVRENLDYACQLYTDANMTQEERHALVSRVIDKLGLTSCQHTRIGNEYLKGVSGGQRRRTSIGVELVGQPNLLILDEITSGLDAAAAAGIMQLLRDIAAAFQLTIVCSIHQPSSSIFLSFDSVMLLTRGKVAYFGKAGDALPFFARQNMPCPPNFNPADHLLLITNADFASEAQVDAITAAWRASEEAAAVQQMVERLEQRGRRSVGQIALLDDNRVALSGLAQTGILARRILGNYRRDPGAYLARIVLFIFMSIFLGTVYVSISISQEDVLNRVFVVEWLVAFFSYMTMSAVPTFAMEKAVVEKELRNGQYSAWSFCLAHLGVQLPFVFALSAAGVTPAYFIATIRTADAEHYFLFLLAMFAFLLCIENLTVLLGTIIPNFLVGLILGNSILSVFFVTNNFFIPLDRMPDFWKFLMYISPYRFAGDMLLHTTFEGTTYDDYEACLNATNTVCFGETGSQILTNLVDKDLADLDYGAWLAVLVGMVLLLRLAIFVILRQIK
jgi:ABC-type multidrug transport system ATPase subunit